jgi:hypothetical protein
MPLGRIEDINSHFSAGLHRANTTYNSDMTVHVLNATVSSRDQKFGLDQLLDRQDDTILDADTNGGSTEKEVLPLC